MDHFKKKKKKGEKKKSQWDGIMRRPLYSKSWAGTVAIIYK